MADTFWDSKTVTYVTAKGKPIAYKVVRASIEAVSNDTASKLKSLTQSFIDGKKTLPAWATESEALIRKSLISSGQIASGGKAHLSNSLNGRLGSIVKFHLGKFREMGLARERGEVSDAQLLARSGMYAEASVSSFEQMRFNVMKDAGYTEARNIPGASKKPCDECPEITARGWISLADYKPNGTRKCLSRDMCGTEYR